MTKITVIKNKDGDICGFVSCGHTDDESVEGEDIYCAYISALTQTACIGLDDVAFAKPEIKTDDGFISAFVKDEYANKMECRTIFRTLVLGLKAFDEAYPGYIQIFEEVQ